MKAQEFEQIRAEYSAAKAAWDEAEARYRAAGQALMAAQCGVHYDTTKGRSVNTHHHCTLPGGHDGEHGKAATA